MRQNNLDTLKSEVEQHLKANGFVTFHGFSRGMFDRPEVEWDTERHSDFREFLAVAQQLGVKVVIFHDREFSAMEVDRALEELEDASYEFDDQREVERRLRELRKFDGFTCALELSFDFQGMTYLFELETEWYAELHKMLDELDMLPDEEDDDENPLSGYYSKN